MYVGGKLVSKQVVSNSDHCDECLHTLHTDYTTLTLSGMGRSSSSFIIDSRKIFGYLARRRITSAASSRLMPLASYSSTISLTCSRRYNCYFLVSYQLTN